MDLVIRMFGLRCPPATNSPDQQADDEERARRQQHQAVGLIPAAIPDRVQDLVAEQGAGAEQFAHGGYEDQDHAVAKAIAETVEEAHANAILHCKGLGATEHDAVGDDQPHEHRQGRVRRALGCGALVLRSQHVALQLALAAPSAGGAA